MSTYSLPTGDFVTSTLNGAITSSASTATIGTGLTIPASNGVLTIDYDSTLGLGVTSGPETISYSSYTSGTGALTGIVRGLAGTTGVAHSNGASVQSAMSTLHLNTVTANTLALTNLTAGWLAVTDTWTYASASTITVPTDATLTYQIGDKIRFKQGGGYKYGVVVTVAATLITILVNTDYTVANSAITDIYYSRAADPFGFPSYFNLTVAVDNLTIGNGTIVGKVSTKGRSAHFWGNVTWGSTTSSGSVMRPNLPITSTDATGIGGGGISVHSGTIYLLMAIPSTTVINMYNNAVSQAIAGNYATPFTYANGDSFSWDVSYPF